METGKTGKYLKYAIGEIILVVIGILIALSINNWQQEKQNIKLEQRYIKDLVNDLKKDSVNLHILYIDAVLSANAKDSIYKVFHQPEYQLDSLPAYFKLQWNPYKIFSPSTSTIDEMKSSSDLEVIRNDAQRKQIVSIYYKYELFLQDENLYREATREIFATAKSGLKNIQKPTSDEIKLLLQDQRLENTIRTNFAKGRVKSIANIADECNSLLKVLGKK
ncbi:DUF6090 family protein [Formosa maritima]|nr:DUF6090 family protein [Formosa maritima]